MAEVSWKARATAIAFLKAEVYLCIVRPFTVALNQRTKEMRCSANLHWSAYSKPYTLVGKKNRKKKEKKKKEMTKEKQKGPWASMTLLSHMLHPSRIIVACFKIWS
jgi:hypothetical protein